MNHIGFAIWWPKSMGTGGRHDWERALDENMSRPIRERIQHEVEWPISAGGDHHPGAVHLVVDRHPLHELFPHKQHPHQVAVLTPTMKPSLRWLVMLRGLHNYKDKLKRHANVAIQQDCAKSIWHRLSLPIVSLCLDTRFAQRLIDG